MTNITFLPARESDAAALHDDVVGAWQATLPLASLQDRQPSYAARSVDATTASTRFDIDAGAAVDWTGFFLGRTDLTAAAQIEISAATSQAGLATPAATTGVLSAWPASGKPTTPPGKAWHDVFKLFSLGSYRWRRVAITDTANPGGRINLGRLVAGRYWRPARNYSYGREKGFDPGDLRIVTPQKHTVSDEGPQCRLWSIPFNYASEADAEDDLEDLVYALGTARDVVVCLNPDATTRLHRDTMLASFEQMPRIVRRDHKTFQFVCVLREMI